MVFSKKTRTLMPLRNNGLSIKVPLIFSFLIITFNLCFYHQLWVKRHVFILEIVLDILHKLIHDSRNVCGCLTLDEMYIELASLITCAINENLTNTSSTLPSEVKNNIIYSKFNNFVYLSRHLLLLKI